jgi:predicted RNA binding protein YcfA (HicA-like mRNA interferase family)
VKLPRDLSGQTLVKALATLGYSQQRQRGSHVTLTTQRDGEHHVTVPLHDPLKPGTLNSILRDLAAHHNLDRESLLELLFGR